MICWGTFEELDFDKLEKTEAMQVFKLLTERIGSIQKNIGIAIPSFSFSFSAKAAPLTVNSRKSILFRILITEKTGRLYAAEK